jgi:hypothetical protein
VLHGVSLTLYVYSSLVALATAQDFEILSVICLIKAYAVHIFLQKNSICTIRNIANVSATTSLIEAASSLE